jgi:hypothetical protein
MLAEFTPPGQVPDEPAHMARAESLWRGQIIGHRQTMASGPDGKSYISAGVDVNEALFLDAFGQVTSISGRPVVTAQNQQAEQAISRGRDIGFATIPNTVRSFPAFYLPAAAGIELGWLAGLSPYHCFLVARLGMLASFLCLGAAALSLATFGGGFLLAVLLLPMTLFLAASLNLDGQMIGAACLGAALLTRNAIAPGGSAAAVALMLIAAAKPPYLPLLFCRAVPLRGPQLAKRLAVAVAAVLMVLFWAAIIAKTVIVRMEVGPYHPGALWPGDKTATLYFTDPAGNLQVLLGKPIRFLVLPLHSLWTLGHQNISEAIGGLGAAGNSLAKSWFLCWGAAAVIAFAGATLPGRADALVWRGMDAILVGVMLIATIYGFELSTYLSWSHLGDPVIEGVTGRYFLPVLPFLPLTVPKLKLSNPDFIAACRLVSIFPVCLLGLFDTIYLPLKLIDIYYVY